jgi:hypothetical protein
VPSNFQLPIMNVVSPFADEVGRAAFASGVPKQLDLAHTKAFRSAHDGRKTRGNHPRRLPRAKVPLSREADSRPPGRSPNRVIVQDRTFRLRAIDTQVLGGMRSCCPG